MPYEDELEAAREESPKPLYFFFLSCRVLYWGWVMNKKEKKRSYIPFFYRRNGGM